MQCRPTRQGQATIPRAPTAGCRAAGDVTDISGTECRRAEQDRRDAPQRLTQAPVHDARAGWRGAHPRSSCDPAPELCYATPETYYAQSGKVLLFRGNVFRNSAYVLPGFSNLLKQPTNLSIPQSMYQDTASADNLVTSITRRTLPPWKRLIRPLDSVDSQPPSPALTRHDDTLRGFPRHEMPTYRLSCSNPLSPFPLACAGCEPSGMIGRLKRFGGCPRVLRADGGFPDHACDERRRGFFTTQQSRLYAFCVPRFAAPTSSEPSAPPTARSSEPGMKRQRPPHALGSAPSTLPIMAARSPRRDCHARSPRLPFHPGSAG